MGPRTITAALAALLLAGCFGGPPNTIDDAGPALPPPDLAAPAPPPTAASPGVAAPGVEAPPPPAPLPNTPDDVVVPGATQITPPEGDPRTVAERREDIQRWDRCVMRVQNRAESDPTRPSLDSPEDICREQLGQASRTAVPARRR